MFTFPHNVFNVNCIWLKLLLLFCFVLFSEFNTVCKQYNKLAQVLITFETLWYTQWKANVESVKGGITMNVLAYNPHDGTIIVNSDSGYQKFSLQLFFLSWLGKLVRIMQKNDFMLTWGKWCRKILCSSWLQNRFLFERNQTATTFSALKKSNTWREKLENVGFSLKISMNNHQAFFILSEYLLSVKRELCFLKLTLSFICFTFLEQNEICACKYVFLQDLRDSARSQIHVPHANGTPRISVEDSEQRDEIQKLQIPIGQSYQWFLWRQRHDPLPDGQSVQGTCAHDDLHILTRMAHHHMAQHEHRCISLQGK